LALAGEAEVTELCMAHESTPVIKPLGPHFGLATLSDSVEGGGIGALRWKNRQFGTIKVLLTMGSCAQGVHDIRVHIDKSCGRLIRLLGACFWPRCQDAQTRPLGGETIILTPKHVQKSIFLIVEACLSVSPPALILVVR